MLGLVPGTHDVVLLLFVTAVVVMSPFARCSLLPQTPESHACVCTAGGGAGPQGRLVISTEEGKESEVSSLE